MMSLWLYDHDSSRSAKSPSKFTDKSLEDEFYHIILPNVNALIDKLLTLDISTMKSLVA
jgi:hypothetical protein